MKDDFKKRLWINLGVILGVIVVAGGAFAFLTNNIQSLSNSITAGRMVLVQQAAQFGMLADLRQNAPAALKYQAAMNQLLPLQDGLLSFPDQVDGIGRTDGVTTDLSFGGTVTQSSPTIPGSINFTMDATGPITNVIAFMKDIEMASPVFLSTFDSFDITQDGTNYTLTAQGRVFFQ